MIRREVLQAGGDRQWALISQIEHARVAAELARRWRRPFFPVSPHAEQTAAAMAELLDAIEHHDDGWDEWERAPDLDPEQGWPRSFTEMPLADSLAIWSKSIAVAEQIGLIAAWAVAGHFCALLAGTSAHASTGDAALARDWIDQLQANRQVWLAAWVGSTTGRTESVAGAALQVLQFFDAFSLWICCTCPPEGVGVPPGDSNSKRTFADGTEFQFSYRPEYAVQRGELRSSGVAGIRPWPFDIDDLRVSAACHMVAIGKYRTPSELVAASKPARLTWRLARHNGATA
jgi:hypothetical protein